MVALAVINDGDTSISKRYTVILYFNKLPRVFFSFWTDLIRFFVVEW